MDPFPEFSCRISESIVNSLLSSLPSLFDASGLLSMDPVSYIRMFDKSLTVRGSPSVAFPVTVATSENQRSSRTFSCSSCKKSFTNESTYENHIKSKKHMHAVKHSSSALSTVNDDNRQIPFVLIAKSVTSNPLMVDMSAREILNAASDLVTRGHLKQGAMTLVSVLQLWSMAEDVTDDLTHSTRVLARLILVIDTLANATVLALSLYRHCLLSLWNVDSSLISSNSGSLFIPPPDFSLFNGTVFETCALLVSHLLTSERDRVIYYAYELSTVSYLLWHVRRQSEVLSIVDIFILNWFCAEIFLYSNQVFLSLSLFQRLLNICQVLDLQLLEVDIYIYIISHEPIRCFVEEATLERWLWRCVDTCITFDDTVRGERVASISNMICTHRDVVDWMIRFLLVNKTGDLELFRTCLISRPSEALPAVAVDRLFGTLLDKIKVMTAVGYSR